MDKGGWSAMGTGLLVGLILVVTVPFAAVGFNTVFFTPDIVEAPTTDETMEVIEPIESRVLYEEFISCPPGSRDRDDCAYSIKRYIYEGAENDLETIPFD